MLSYRFEFLSATRHWSACQIQVVPSFSLVVATCQGEGTSVTNECELIATAVTMQHGLKPNRLIFIEHYPDQLWEYFEETFKLITFQQVYPRYSQPVWTELNSDNIYALMHWLEQEP